MLCGFLFIPAILLYKLEKKLQKLTLNFVKENKIVSADYDTTIKSVADENGICLASHCGGAGVCGACRVKILQGSVSDVTQTEKQFLSEQELKAGFRLACKARVQGDLVIENSFSENKIKILDDVLPFRVKANSKNAFGLGVAVDLGTTSVVATVFDMADEKLIGRVSFANPQASFGSDIMSRIASVTNDVASLRKMQRLLHNSLYESITGILCQNDKTKEDITKIVVSGNTVMQHIFVGSSPSSMGSAPYKPSFLYHSPIHAKEIGLLFANALIYFVPNISAFVGGDITSGLTALDFDCKNKNETALFIDLGTNNEMALLADGQIFATSTAAGPAFEGAGISQGVRAVEGAICSVSFEKNRLVSHTIGDKRAIGLCGSGMIDCLAVFLENDIMLQNGSLNEDNPLVYRNEDGVLQVTLAEEEKVCITQKDIRSLQLVIASIKAGIKVLFKRTAKSEESLNKIYLAGAFGNFINIKNARKIGLLPSCNSELVSAKNTSLFGAIKALFEDDFLTRARSLSQKVTTINLANEADFETSFINSLDF